MTENLKEYINEYVKKVITENFLGKEAINELKNSQDVYHVYDILDKYNITKLGEGSSRSVYRISKDRVLKVAGGNRADINIGLAQNEAEVQAYTNPKTDKDIVPRIYDYHPEYFWLISEQVMPYESPVDFETDVGLSSSFMKQFLTKLALKGYNEGMEELKEEYEQEKLNPGRLRSRVFVKNYESAFFGKGKDFFNKMVQLMLSNELSPGDISYSQFGKTTNGKVVLFDTGLDMNVLNTGFYDN